jgi:primosomal replication protein N
MRFIVSILALAAVAGSGSAIANSPPEIPVPQIVGGWSSVQADSDAHKAANFALPHLRRGRARLQSVDAVDTQVVAGLNYRLILTLSDRSRWQVVVFRGLDQKFHFTSKRRLPAQ